MITSCLHYSGYLLIQCNSITRTVGKLPSDLFSHDHFLSAQMAPEVIYHLQIQSNLFKLWWKLLFIIPARLIFLLANAFYERISILISPTRSPLAPNQYVCCAKLYIRLTAISLIITGPANKIFPSFLFTSSCHSLPWKYDVIANENTWPHLYPLIHFWGESMRVTEI